MHISVPVRRIVLISLVLACASALLWGRLGAHAAAPAPGHRHRIRRRRRRIHREVDGRREAPESRAASADGDLPPAPPDASRADARLVVDVRHRDRSRPDRDLRLPPPRPEDLHARLRRVRGDERAVPLRRAERTSSLAADRVRRPLPSSPARSQAVRDGPSARRPSPPAAVALLGAAAAWVVVDEVRPRDNAPAS